MVIIFGIVGWIVNLGDERMLEGMKRRLSYGRRHVCAKRIIVQFLMKFYYGNCAVILKG